MNRLQGVFDQGRAFIPFITAGDPSLALTEKLVLQLAAAGADLIELGIPFSDPVAEGDVIQAADARALANGYTTDTLFAMIRRIRTSSPVPIALMTYVNPIFVFGTDRFMKNCHECSIDAVIVPDVPYEEKDELLLQCRKHGITLISMIAPTSQQRIQMIAREAEGFVYCVSSLGVTGVRRSLDSEVEKMIRLVKEVKDIPCAVGFGISTPEQAVEMAQAADGIIVGSAIVKIVEQYGHACVPHVVEYVKMMKQAIG
ncbi:MAG: tryptophan synthase subunit alpha [Firmicutes bacterium]|nr:tryptophan synthase subunit alpha [Bacillota bacterium]